uniref:Uncharacterized protein n=1 Tax=Fagus sylvatica TaxID=28930 RepID=A0A2N9FWH6_FAGSY
MKLQERVKILIWRIGNDILPTKGNLATRAEMLNIVDCANNVKNIIDPPCDDCYELYLKVRFLECLESFDPKKDRNHKVIQTWSCPPIGMVKLNVDAATTDELAWLPVVARDESGNILKLWTKATSLSDPVVVDANAI